MQRTFSGGIVARCPCVRQGVIHRCRRDKVLALSGMLSAVGRGIARGVSMSIPDRGPWTMPPVGAGDGLCGLLETRYQHGC